MKHTLSVLGTGTYLPQSRPVREVVSEAGADSSVYEGWLKTCQAKDEDHPSTMGAAALRAALADAGVDPSELKLVLFAGMSRDYPASWSVAMEIMKDCGAPDSCLGLDMTVGCLGSLNALDMAQGWLAVHGGGVAAVVAAERWTYTVDYASIENYGLWGHGDGAGAAVVSLDTPHEAKAKFGGAEFVTQSDLNGMVLVEYGGTRNPIAPPGVAPYQRKLMLKDRGDIRKRSSKGYLGSYNALKARLNCDPHRAIMNQTSKLFMQLIAQVIDIPIENFVLTGDDTGHVGSADVFIGLDHVLKNGGVDEPYLMAGSTPYAFGSGLITPK